MKRLLLPALLLAFTAYFAQAQSDLPTYNPDDIDVPYRKFTLPNGLRLIVHEDHKAPIAAVNVWYHVGSKNEKPGKSGFAHLFEHLMFNGSEHYNTDYFQALEAIGATDLNGTTNEDRTNYFQNVPLNALDQVLFLESDRMGHLLKAVDQAKLDEQRGVVQNEKRQGENQPYAREWELFTKEMFPPHHPYGHTVIGEMADLNAASLDDVHEWFKTYYGAANAVLVVAGDVKTEEIYEKVLKYFGNIPAGPTLARYEKSIPRRTGEVRMSYQDRVPEAKIEMVWNVPEWGSAESVWLDLASDVLASGKNSRLYKKLVIEKQLAVEAYAWCYPQEIAGQFHVGAVVKKGHTVEEVEAALNEVVAEFLKNGPTEDEMKRVKANYFANFIKGLERIGGFGGKSDLLAQNEVYGGSPDFYKKQLRRYSEATAKLVHETSKNWLSDGKLVVIAEPFPEYSTTGNEADRSKLPELAGAVNAQFPEIQRTTLKNGLKVVLARRKESPTVVMSMMFDAGYVTDKFGGKLGLAALGMNMLDEGTTTRTSLQINERLQLLGASINTFSDLDYSYANLNTLKQSLDPSLDLYADVLLNPAFPEGDFNRLRDQQLSGIESEKSEPFSMAMRVAPMFMYGENHPYGMPMTGSGTEESVRGIELGDVRNFRERWLRPNNATLTVVGDISMEELTAKLEKRFGSWQKADVPKKVIPEVKNVQNNGKLFLIDRPESQQSVLVAGYLTKKYGELDEDAVEQMNNVLGGDFTSRINMNIREDKHWSYGSRSWISDTKGQRPFLVVAPVQTDKTKESAQEVVKELNAYIGDKPMTQAEFDKTKRNTVLGMAGMWETNGRVNRSLQQLVKYNLSDDYWKKYSDKVNSLTLNQVHAAAKSVVQPSQLGWFVTGDKAKVLPGLQTLNLEIIEIDADGKPVSKKTKP
ncbi:MAG: M16 family metallopeptidase [Saprospiraceae bacterium]